MESLPMISADSVTCFVMIHDDLVHNILSRLPAKSFASATCVSKYWNIICNRILSRPKLSSAISINRSLSAAVKEVVNKVLSEPIRPHFAIVNVGARYALKSTLLLITEHFGRKLPIIVSTVQGVIGRDALNSEFKEVMFDSDTHPITSDGILLTVGFLPGLKVEVIPLQKTQASQEQMIDKFAMDIRDYSASVSRLGSPIGIMMFCSELSDMGPVLDKLDCAMPVDTVIVGDRSSSFVWQCANGLREPFGKMDNSEAVALVFARTGDNSLGEIQFQTSLSSGLSLVGARHEAVSVKNWRCSTCLLARMEGHPEILDGESILDNIYHEVHNRILNPAGAMYIGVTKRRKISVASQNPKIRTSLAFHPVIDGDEGPLFVLGNDIRTGDYFQFYLSDPIAAQSSCIEVSLELKKFKQEKNSTHVFGGFIFACCGRGSQFFRCDNVDSSPFLENFPGVPLAGAFVGGETGLFCGGEIGRVMSSPIRSCLHVYSSVYLVMSYTPPLTC